MLTINANLILKPGFGAKKEAASGSFRITYSGDEGFQIKGGNSQASGSIDGTGNFDHITTASLAPHAILIGMAAPKITLQPWSRICNGCAAGSFSVADGRRHGRLPGQDRSR